MRPKHPSRFLVGFSDYFFRGISHAATVEHNALLQRRCSQTLPSRGRSLPSIFRFIRFCFVCLFVLSLASLTDLAVVFRQPGLRLRCRGFSAGVTIFQAGAVDVPTYLIDLCFRSFFFFNRRQQGPVFYAAAYEGLFMATSSRTIVENDTCSVFYRERCYRYKLAGSGSGTMICSAASGL